MAFGQLSARIISLYFTSISDYLTSTYRVAATALRNLGLNLEEFCTKIEQRLKSPRTTTPRAFGRKLLKPRRLSNALSKRLAF